MELEDIMLSKISKIELVILPKLIYVESKIVKFI
jgi:hypothetical protein